MIYYSSSLNEQTLKLFYPKGLSESLTNISIFFVFRIIGRVPATYWVTIYNFTELYEVRHVINPR